MSADELVVSDPQDGDFGWNSQAGRMTGVKNASGRIIVGCKNSDRLLKGFKPIHDGFDRPRIGVFKNGNLDFPFGESCRELSASFPVPGTAVACRCIGIAAERPLRQ